MAKERRCFKHKDVLFLTNRLAEGLPFVPNEYINAILFGILARASALYDGVTICAWLFLQNHYHGIVALTGDPADLPRFMNYVDGETAKIVSKLLSRSRCKFWSSKYDSVKLCDGEVVLKKMKYLFLNPVESQFVDTAAEWFGVSTWESLFDETPRNFKWIRPSDVSRLSNAPLTPSKLDTLLGELAAIDRSSTALKVEPFAWMNCFQETRNRSVDSVRTSLLRQISAGEEECRNVRAKNKQRLADKSRLSLQNPHKYYRPSDFGKSVFCMASDPALAKVVTKAFREFCAACRKVWELWKAGQTHISYPPGAFRPPRLPTVSLLQTDCVLY